MEELGSVNSNFIEWPLVYRCLNVIHQNDTLGKSYLVLCEISEILSMINMEIDKLTKEKTEKEEHISLIENVIMEYKKKKKKNNGNDDDYYYSDLDSELSQNPNDFKDHSSNESSDSSSMNSNDFTDCEFELKEKIIQLSDINSKIDDEKAKLTNYQEKYKSLLEWTSGDTKEIVRIDKPIFLDNKATNELSLNILTSSDNNLNNMKINKNQSKFLFVCKILENNKGLVEKQDPRGDHQLRHSVNVLINHLSTNISETGVLPILDTFLVEMKIKNFSKLYATGLVKPFCKNSNIIYWVKKIEETEALNYSSDFLYENLVRILRTLRLLDSFRIHHGHIKPTNLLVSDCGNYLLLDDIFDHQYIRDYFIRVKRVNDIYIAPELYKLIVNDATRTEYDRIDWLKSDFFSLALCFYFLCSKQEPDPKIHKSKAFLENKIKFFSTDSVKLTKLLKSLLSWNPKDRIFSDKKSTFFNFLKN